VQSTLKEKGLPWEKAKAFDHSAVIGNFISKKNYSSLENINFELKSNQVTVQEGNTSLMLWKIDELIAYVSQYFTLKIGDIIFTGTPKGVAKVTEGDVLEGFIEGESMFKIQIR
jgi:2-keto-4-pentenoate hydratase/2-oxohepta-3-ene-1,7-dioic acid hydratase in catechol pathway